jgi:glycosyltransferase involved in cell wall biosynthesis
MNVPESVQNAVDLSVLVTCYNEEQYIVNTLDTLVSALRKVGVSHEIIVIDDASKDASLEKIREYQRRHSDYPIVLKANPKNRGLANNYVDGAFIGRGKYYHLVCGDDSMPEEFLVAVYRLLGKADMIIPYQIQSEISGKSKYRRIISRTFTRFVNLLSGYNLKYYNGIALQLRYNVMRWHPVSYGFGFQADTVTMLLDQGVSYLQVYSRSIDKKGSGSTSISMQNFLSVGHTLLEIAIRRVRRALYGRKWPKPVEIHLPDNEINK